MSVMASQITSLTIVYSSVYSGTDERKHQSSASLAFVRGIHRWARLYCELRSSIGAPVNHCWLQWTHVQAVSLARWALMKSFSTLTPDGAGQNPISFNSLAPGSNFSKNNHKHQNTLCCLDQYTAPNNSYRGYSAPTPTKWKWVPPPLN